MTEIATPQIEEEPPQLILRRLTSDDVPFVLSSWVRSHRRCGDVSQMSDARYYSSYRGHVLRLLQTASVVIASPAEDAGQIVGYLCCDHLRELAHYVYVKRVFRKFGVARRLWEYAGMPKAATTLWPVSFKRDGEYRVSWHVLAAQRLGIEFDPYSTGEGSKHAHAASHPE